MSSSQSDTNRNSQNTNSVPLAPVIDRDHEIALQLQRQFDSQHSSVPPPSSNNPNNHNANNPLQHPQNQPPQGSFFQFSSNNNNNNANPSSSSVSYSFTTTDNNGTRTVHYGNNPNANPFGSAMSGFNHPFFTNANGQNNNPFNDPFFAQHRRNNNNQNHGNDIFNDPFFSDQSQQMGMPRMVNMNMMINNLMMGNDGGIPFGLLAHHRPRVADQGNVDALPTDTYKVNEENKENEATEEDDDETNNEVKEKETCSICLEPFKNGDTIKRLPCLHIFHQNEIDRWLLTGNDKCPICRMPINGQQNQ